MAQKKMTPRKPPHNIEVDKYRYLLAVTDNLRLELVQVYEKNDEKMYVYKYTEVFGQTGKASTKYNTELPVLISQLETEISKGVFKVINHDND